MAETFQDTRYVWLDEPVALGSKAPGIAAKLCGVYDGQTHYVTIYLIITYNGTDYRVTRYHRQVNTLKENNIERLRYLHRNMTSHFLKEYRDSDLRSVMLKFLKWTKNPVHKKVLGELI